MLGAVSASPLQVAAARALAARDILETALAKGYTRRAMSATDLRAAAQANDRGAFRDVWWPDPRGSRHYANASSPELASDITLLQSMLGQRQTGIADSALLNALRAHRDAPTTLGDWARNNFWLNLERVYDLHSHAHLPLNMLEAHGWNQGTNWRGVIGSPPFQDLLRANAWQQDFNARPVVADAASANAGAAPAVRAAGVAARNHDSAVQYGWWTDPRGGRRYTGPDSAQVVTDILRAQEQMGMRGTGIADRDTLVRLKAHVQAGTPLGEFVRANYFLGGGRQAKNAWAAGTGRPAVQYVDRMPDPTDRQVADAVREAAIIGERPSYAAAKRSAFDLGVRELNRILTANRAGGLQASPPALRATQDAAWRAAARVAQGLIQDDRNRLRREMDEYVALALDMFVADRLAARARAANAIAAPMITIIGNTPGTPAGVRQKAGEDATKMGQANQGGLTLGKVVVLETAAQDLAAAADKVNPGAKGARDKIIADSLNLPPVRRSSDPIIGAAEDEAAADGVPGAGVPAVVPQEVVDASKGGSGAGIGLLAALAVAYAATR